MKRKVDILLDLQSLNSLNDFNLQVFKTLRAMVRVPVGAICGTVGLIKENVESGLTVGTTALYGLKTVDNAGKSILDMLDTILVYNSLVTGVYTFDPKLHASDDLVSILKSVYITTGDISVEEKNMYMFDTNALIFVMKALTYWVRNKIETVSVIGAGTNFIIKIETSGLGDISKVFDAFADRPLTEGNLDIFLKMSTAKKMAETLGGSLLTDGDSVIIEINNQ